MRRRLPSLRRRRLRKPSKHLKRNFPSLKMSRIIINIIMMIKIMINRIMNK